MSEDAAGIRVLLVDDDHAFREALADELSLMGFSVTSVVDAESALHTEEDRIHDVAIVDLNLPGMSGESLIHELRQSDPSMEIIVLTGNATVENAVRTLKDGVHDFLTKPCSLDELEAVVRNAYQKRSLLRQNRLMRRELDRHHGFREFVGRSPQLGQVLRTIEKLSMSDSTVLIQGESGVGKELAARAVHRTSTRSKQPIIVVDCTSLQESLLQSELFGHERGAFTGAVARKHGLFEVADRGTLFLDEIGEITLPLQARILRVLDTGTFRRVGGVKNVKVDVRVICATNRDLYRMVQEGGFRQDLYYRINVVSFTLPPLRERRDDIPMLAEYFAQRSPISRRRPVKFSPEASSILRSYHWPGNVRELQNIVERALILADGGQITAQDLPGNLRHAGGTVVDELTAKRPTLEALESAYIAKLLGECGGHRQRVAELLGISERTLYRKLKGIPTPPEDDEA